MEISSEFKSTNRILKICEEKKADTYINSVGGQDLYDKREFFQHGVNLRFLKSSPIFYYQGCSNFQPYLSMLDVLMWNDKATVKELMTQYELI